MSIPIFFLIVIVLVALIYFDIAHWQTEVVTVVALIGLTFVSLFGVVLPIKIANVYHNLPITKYKTDREIIIYVDQPDYQIKQSYTDAVEYNSFDRIKSVDAIKHTTLFGGLAVYTITSLNTDK